MFLNRLQSCLSHNRYDRYLMRNRKQSDKNKILSYFDIRVTLDVLDNLVSLGTKDVLDPKVGTDP